jgi:hypothetical protein
MLIPCTTSRFSLAVAHRPWVKSHLFANVNAKSSILLRSLASTTNASHDAAHRHTGILMHPDSISKNILPGNMTIKKNKKGDGKKRYTELVYGYFWMIKDLKKSDDKPILSNDALIPESVAKPFPVLNGLKSLAGEKVDIPDHFIRKNRSRDAAAQCTLVAVSYRDFGYKLLDSWIEPFESALQGKDRVEIVKLNLSEGWLNKWILQACTRTRPNFHLLWQRSGTLSRCPPHAQHTDGLRLLTGRPGPCPICGIRGCGGRGCRESGQVCPRAHAFVETCHSSELQTSPLQGYRETKAAVGCSDRCGLGM